MDNDLFQPAVPAHYKGVRVATICNLHLYFSRFWPQFCVENRAEALQHAEPDEGVIQLPQQVGGRAFLGRQGPGRIPGDASQRRRFGAHARDIAEYQAPDARADLEHVVEVPAHVSGPFGRSVPGSDVEARDLGKSRG